MSFSSVSAVVCAYNEEKTVKPILLMLLTHPRVNEVIAVDDGSTDRTWEEISSVHHSKLIPIHHSNNRGKGAAMVTGVSKSNHQTILFVDADLSNLLPRHIDLLLWPIDIDPTGMTIGVVYPSKTLDRALQLLMKPLGGQRVIKKHYIKPFLKRMTSSGYGVEMILNTSTLRKGRKIYYVPLPKLKHTLKTEKRDFPELVKEYWKEQNDILKQMFDLDTMSQMPTFKGIIEKIRQLP